MSKALPEVFFNMLMFFTKLFSRLISQHLMYLCKVSASKTLKKKKSNFSLCSSHVQYGPKETLFPSGS